MEHSTHNQIISFIWGIADDVLRDVFVRGKYRDVILPMTVVRRLDALLEPTKAEVLAEHARLQADPALNNEAVISSVLKKITGIGVYNTSPYTLATLKNEPTHLRDNLEHYLRSFSYEVQDILLKFKLYHQLDTLAEAGAIGKLLDKFTDPRINLSPRPITEERDGKTVTLKPGLSNLGMGYVFEELIRRFNEENNEEAGEHFTPRDIIRLITHLAFEPVAHQLRPGYTVIYDDACGSGGMLTEGETFLKVLLGQRGIEARVGLYGQEINPETYAIAQADMLIKGERDVEIAYGSTLSKDAFPDMKFDFMFANPPYGKSWALDKETIVVDGSITDDRFKIGLPRSSDGQLLFLLNKISKMQDPAENGIGSRIVHVHNGSALFTGDAGSGESEIRRYILENDLLEAIIGLPLNMFYNTGIATYLWVLSNNKAPHRKGKVQLIDATQRFQRLRKNLGKKNCEFSDAQIEQIMAEYQAFAETPTSKIFDTADFGYRKITVERPLRLNYSAHPSRVARLKDQRPLQKLLAERGDDLRHALTQLGSAVYTSEDQFERPLLMALARHQIHPTKAEAKALFAALSERDPSAQPVPRRSKAKGSGAKAGASSEYEPDADLRDIENVPLKDDVTAYFEREVLPHVPDAWIDESATKIGYEINFTRYFYQYKPLRKLSDIAAEILKLEQETDGVLREIVKG